SPQRWGKLARRFAPDDADRADTGMVGRASSGDKVIRPGAAESNYRAGGLRDARPVALQLEPLVTGNDRMDEIQPKDIDDDLRHAGEPQGLQNGRIMWWKSDQFVLF